jgi:hypothetical protein
LENRFPVVAALSALRGVSSGLFLLAMHADKISHDHINERIRVIVILSNPSNIQLRIPPTATQFFPDSTHKKRESRIDLIVPPF